MSVKLRFKSLKDGSKSVYLDIYLNGVRKYEFLNVHIHRNDPSKKDKIRLVERMRSMREVEHYEYELGMPNATTRKNDFIEYYREFIANYPGKDKRLVRYSLDKFLLMLGKKRLPFASLTPKLCLDYSRYLKSPDSGLTGETPYNYWMKFRRVLKEAVIEGILRENPASNIVVRRKTNQLKKNVLNTDELKRLISADCGHDQIKRAFIFASFTGLGMAEIRKLQRKHIQNERLHILREKSKEQVINDLHPVALAMLENPLPSYPDIHLFDLPSDTTVAKHLKRWVANAGIEKNISFYCARHTFATQLLLNGANLKTVADCLGHSSTSHTLKYLNFVDDLKSDAILRLPMIIE